MLPTIQQLLRMFRPQPPVPPSAPVIAPPGATPSHSGSCGTLVATDGRVLPLQAVSLSVQARGGVARAVLSQRFLNPHADPLHVTYRMGLPADAAVSGYAFSLAGRRVVGEVDKKHKARERFEQALLDGKTAGLVEQERSSVFTQELGNVPPGAEITAEITVDQRLLWRTEGAWEWRFPTTVGARYVGQSSPVPDADKLEVEVAAHGVPARLSLAMTVNDALAGAPESPSHQVTSTREGDAMSVALAEAGGAPLDRDVVVRWPVAARAIGATIEVGRPRKSSEAYGLLTLVPPLPEAQVATSRDLILLLDTSGSMTGVPLAQLQATSLALLATLSKNDTLEMIEFSSQARRWQRGATRIDEKVRAEAAAWIMGLTAGGSTEMVAAMIKALTPLSAESQRQVILMTDGYIGAESQVIGEVMRKLPHGACRVHVVGVGSSVNRTLTGGVARAGGGVEVIIGPEEEPASVVANLLARTTAPLVTGLQVQGEALLAQAPAHLPDLYAGAPALVSLKLRPEGGPIEVSGKTAAGPWRARVQAPACAAGHGSGALAPLFGREAVEDLEMARTIAPEQHQDIDQTIEQLGLELQISTRLTTWVAISEEATVDPTRPTRREVMPTELPHGVSAEGLGLRSAAPQVLLSRPAQEASYLGPVPAAAPAPPSMMMDLAGPTGRPRLPMRGMPPGNATKARVGLVQPAPVVAKAAESRKREASGADEAEEDRSIATESAKQLSRAERAQEGANLAAARVRQQLPDRLVLEIEVRATLEWKLGATLVVQTATGFVTVQVLPGSTSNGSYSAGHTLRLVLEAAPLGGALPKLLVLSPDLTIPVTT